jgi:ribonuclease HI
MKNNRNNLDIYTDGASTGQRRGGVGVVYIRGDTVINQFYTAFNDVTNNQMEIMAILIALKGIVNHYDCINLYSDSMYCIGTITSNYQIKSNKKLWIALRKEIERVRTLCPNLNFIHVKGHTDNDWNNYADKLAVKGSKLYYVSRHSQA